MTGPQASVATNMAFGVVGEIFLGSYWRAQPGIIDGDGATNPNRVGRVFTQVVGSDGHVIVGGAGPLAGILANPKVYASAGVAGDPLGATLDLPQYAKGEFVYDTTGIIVALGAAANVGDDCYYDTTTGVISTQPGSWPATGAQQIAYASNVATVTLTPPGMPPIGPGSVITTADGQVVTVVSLLSGTGGNGTYNVGTAVNHAAQSFSFTRAAAPSGKARLQGFSVQRYSPTAAGLAVIGVTN